VLILEARSLVDFVGISVWLQRGIGHSVALSVENGHCWRKSIAWWSNLILTVLSRDEVEKLA